MAVGGKSLTSGSAFFKKVGGVLTLHGSQNETWHRDSGIMRREGTLPVGETIPRGRLIPTTGCSGSSTSC